MNRLWRHVGPWATPSLAVVEITLVTSGLLPVRTAVTAGVIIEAAFWVTALSRTTAAVRRYRLERTQELDGWVAAEDALAHLVPRPIARALLIEPRLLSCLVRWSTGRHEGRAPGAFSYHRNLWSLLVTIVALVAGEGAVVETLLVLLVPGSPWVWVALAVHAYALVWIAGFLASLVTRPHRIVSDALCVRDGIFSELQIPYGAIAGARTIRRANFGRSGLKVDPASASAIVAMGDATVELDLDPAAEIHRSGTSTPLYLKSLYITVDDPPAFVRDLHARCVGRDRPSSVSDLCSAVPLRWLAGHPPQWHPGWSVQAALAPRGSQANRPRPALRATPRSARRDDRGGYPTPSEPSARVAFATMARPR